MKTGERFPFSCPTAKGFGLDTIEDRTKRFAAGMEAVGFLERLGIEKLAQLGLSISNTVFATGGGVTNETWLRIRASINRRTYAVSGHPECAVGAAVLAAAATLGDCGEAIRRMVRIARRVEPDAHLAEQYDQQYHQFRDELHQRGYL